MPTVYRLQPSWCAESLSIEQAFQSSPAGIGRSIHRIEQIDQLQRPLSMEDGGVVLMDLLWSDPTTNDSVEGVQPSPRGPGLVTFGPDRVKEFCKVSLTWSRAGQGRPAACHSRAWLPCFWLHAGEGNHRSVLSVSWKILPEG